MTTPIETQKRYRLEAQDNPFMFSMWAEGYIELYDYATQLEAENDKMERLIIYAGGILAHGTPGSAWMDWKMRVQSVLGMKFHNARFGDDRNAIPFSKLADRVKDIPRITITRLALGGE